MRTMSTIAFSLSLSLLAALPARAATPQATANHPLVGTWTIASPDRKCVESYQYLPNGIVKITSGEGMSESTYSISAAPVANGFYKYADEVTKDNGKKDCSGEFTHVGEKSISYMQFDPRNELLIVCQSPTDKECIGPLRRALPK
jgi:hypothetical protein